MISMRIPFTRLAPWATAIAIAASANAANFYVSPSGSPAGAGTLSSPWNIATAMAHPSAVHPGDTIYLRGGTYRGSYRSVLKGTVYAPIVVRPYQNERVVFDGASAPSPTAPMYGALTIAGDYSWFRDFEITNSYPTRIYAGSSCLGYQHCRGHGVDVFGAGTKLINLVIHDTSDAVGLWSPAVDAEVIGCIIYYIGNQTETRGHGMGIYAQNYAGTKRITNNIIFSGFHSGIQIYGSSASSLRNVIVEGNTIFQNGLLSADPNGWGILVGGSVLADSITIRNNYLYNPGWFHRSSNVNPSWGVLGSTRLNFTNNDSTGYRSIEYTTAPTGSTVSGNQFYGIMNYVADASISKSLNTVATAQPSSPRVYYRNNPYDSSVTYTTIFNGAGTSTVRITPPLLAEGDSYELRDAQNYFGTPLSLGTYSAATGLNVPMNSTLLSPVVGTPPRYPVPSGPYFGAFIIRKTSGSSGPPSAPDSVSQPASCEVGAVCEAEHGALVSPMAAPGTFIMSTVANSGTASYTFDLAAPATISVWLRVFALDSYRDSFYLSVDGGTESLFQLTSGWSSSVFWTQATWTPQLPAGRHTLRIRAREANTGLDAIAISHSSWHPN